MNEPQTIPASELGFVEKDAVSKISPEEIFRILAAKQRRGSRICLAFFFIGVVAVAIGLFYRHTWGTVAAGVVCVASRVGVMVIHRKLILAHRISHEPQVVYWAHPCRSSLIGFPCILTLHARNGQALELPTSHEEARRVTTWLLHHNPAVRLGDYDDTPQPANDGNT